MLGAMRAALAPSCRGATGSGCQVPLPEVARDARIAQVVVFLAVVVAVHRGKTAAAPGSRPACVCVALLGEGSQLMRAEG